jgi:CCR4-NOT transcription complex subunit 4
MSTAAQALLDDVKARREAPPPSTYVSPFPDFDRTLQTLSGGEAGGFGGFSFNLDPKLAGDDTDTSAALPDFDAEANTPFHGTFTDAFPALRPPGHGSPSIPFVGPPGISYPHNPSRPIYDPLTTRPIERQSTGGSNYTGSFNPFAEVNDDSVGSSPPRKPQYSPLDEDRKVSRFGFARGRQGSTAASSPLHVSSPLSSNNNNDSHASLYNSNELSAPQSSQWPIPNRQQQQQPDYGYSQSNSQLSSPLAPHAQAQAAFSQQPSRFQPFDSGVSEAQLRELIQSSRERAGPTTTNDSPAGMRLLFV